MKLEQQVCSLELAKRLRELGVKQESEFYWRQTESKEIRQNWEEGDNREVIVGQTKPKWYLTRSDKVRGDKGIGIIYENHSAFTVAELGEMLPEEIEIGEISYFLRVSHELQGRWEIAYCNSSECYMPMSTENEAEGRALMLIYLLESKLITL